MECSNVMDGGHIVDSSNVVNRGNSLDSSNIVNRGHRLHSSNTMNRVDSLDYWSSISSISSISNAVVSSIIRISLPLGHMDSASRVSNIATSSSIGSGSHYSGDSSRGCSSDRKGGRGGHLGVSIVVSMVNTSDVVNRSHSIDTGNIVDWSSSMNSSNILNSSNMMNRGGRLNSSNVVNRGNIVNSSNIVNRSGSMECSDIVDSSNVVNRGNSLDSSNIVNRGNSLNSSNVVNRVDSLNSSNIVNRGHRLHSSNAVNRVDSLNHWSSISSISSISNAIVSSIIRISLPLGHMDSASRVSNIATSSSIGSGSHYSRHSSRGCSSDRKGGRGRHLSVSNMVVPMVDRRSVAIATVSTNPSISQAINTSISQPLETRVSHAISSISSIAKDVRVSLSSNCCSQAENSQEFVHVEEKEETTSH